MKGYDFWIDDNFQARRMEDTADIIIELVELMQKFGSTDVPQAAIIENEVISVIECRYVFIIAIQIMRIR